MREENWTYLIVVAYFTFVIHDFIMWYRSFLFAIVLFEQLKFDTFCNNNLDDWSSLNKWLYVQ